jgi:hypothetical protein
VDKNSSIGEMQIVEIKDHDDGSATVTFDMSPELLKFFAEIGIRKVIMDSVANTIQNGSDHEHS